VNEEFREMVNRQNFVILDVESTGRMRPFQVCEISIVAHDGRVLLDTLVKPTISIVREAADLTGVTNEMVQDAPSWREIEPLVSQAIMGKDVITYGAKFDREAMHQSDEAVGLGHIAWKEIALWWDALQAYSDFYNEPHERYSSAKWQGLGAAINQQGLQYQDGHRALYDCQMLLRLIVRVFVEDMGVTYAERQAALPPAEPMPRPNELKKLARKYEHRIIHTGHLTFEDEIARWGAEGFAYKGFYPQGVDTWLVFERYTLDIAEI
jgi:DNA polymerase-3 subunit epsilon